MASGIMSPPKWDEGGKQFDLWLREVKAWKAATEHVTGLKNVHGLQLALHLPDNSEIRSQVFDSLDIEELKGDTGFDKVLELLQNNYSKDENTSAFQTWKEFKSLCRKDSQTIDQYIMTYDQYKSKMRRYKMDLGERIHGLNLLCSANNELQIAMREVDHEKPDEIYNMAKSLSRNTPGSSREKKSAPFKDVKQEPADPEYASFVAFKKMEKLALDTSKNEHPEAEYESFVAWKQHQKYRQDHSRNYMKYARDGFVSDKFCGEHNPLGRDGQPLQCRTCKSIAHFERNCPHRKNYKSKNSDTTKTYLASTSSDII